MQCPLHDHAVPAKRVLRDGCLGFHNTPKPNAKLCMLQAPPVSPEEAHRDACEAGWEPPPEVRNHPCVAFGFRVSPSHASPAHACCGPAQGHELLEGHVMTCRPCTPLRPQMRFWHGDQIAANIQALNRRARGAAQPSGYRPGSWGRRIGTGAASGGRCSAPASRHAAARPSRGTTKGKMKQRVQGRGRCSWTATRAAVGGWVLCPSMAMAAAAPCQGRA